MAPDDRCFFHVKKEETMNEFIFETLKLIVMVAGLLIARHVIPWLKAQTQNEQTQEIAKWVEQAVLMAQQVHWAKTGAEKKQIVIQILHGILAEKGLQISDEQLDTLIEAAVKAMKMAETAA